MTSQKNEPVRSRRIVLAFAFLLALAVATLMTDSNHDFTSWIRGPGSNLYEVQIAVDSEGHYLSLPPEVLEAGLYKNDTFANYAGNVPTYWEGKLLRSPSRDRRPTYGPCYAYTGDKVIDWNKEIERYNTTKTPWFNTAHIDMRKTALDLEGYCRPGFLIIGAGKCGTSSLYHYVTSHPNVLPASQKQIHYFKYHRHEPLKWYYAHFPSTASFISAGALLTGEASPGYLPYPDVVIDMKKAMPKPKLLMIGRNPIERSYSSYKYNYVNPLLAHLRVGKEDGIEKNQPDEYYNQYIFSFEDMMRAELAVLRQCFQPGSKAEQETRQRWGTMSEWIENEYERRERENLPSLIDLDGFCYGGTVNSTVLRRQWTHLVAEQPEKIIRDRNTHLTQALIGRSLYLFPLEWWYAAFDPSHLYFVCTEELQDLTGESMSLIGEFLGLPRFDNFSTVVQAGAYNVGGHKGYDTEVTLKELQEEHKSSEIPLSAEFRKELEDFIRPYNERLFRLTGRRCDW